MVHILAIGGVIFQGFRQEIYFFNLSQWFIIFLFIYYLFKNIINGKILINKFLLFLIPFMFFSSFIYNQTWNISSIKTFLGIIIYILSYYWYFQFSDFKKTIYLFWRISIFIAILGILQEVSYFLRFKYLVDFSIYGITTRLTYSGPFLRITSILSEPASLAKILLPSLFLIVEDQYNYKIKFLKMKSWQKFVVILNFILTFSLVSYFYLFILGIYFNFKKRGHILNKLIFVLIVIFIATSSYFFIDNINNKVNSLFYDSELLVSGSGRSAFALITNYGGALESIKEQPIFGTGLNTHEPNIKNYINTYFHKYKDDIIYNKNVSLYSRILSEFGLAGFLIFIIFILKFKFNKKINDIYLNSNIYMVSNKMAMILILLISVRNGSYFTPILFYLGAMYIYSYSRSFN